MAVVSFLPSDLTSIKGDVHIAVKLFQKNKGLPTTS